MIIKLVVDKIHAHYTHKIHTEMKVYFTASTAQFNKYKDNYFAIRDFLIEENHTLTRDWLKHTGEKIKAGKSIEYDIRAIYQKCMIAINKADLVIIEDTVSNFSTGHQITVALQRQKPTLVLWQGDKHRHFKTMFIHGIESDYLEIANYTNTDYKQIIRKFINKYQHIHEKTRFNLVINQMERNYLDWIQLNKGQSRTRVIRNALKNEIAKDKEFAQYLEQLT